MRGRLAGAVCLLVAAWALAGAGAGCQLVKGPSRPVPLPPGVGPNDLVAPGAEKSETLNVLEADQLVRIAGDIRKAIKPKVLPEKKHNVLVLSGGAAYGAYSSGVLVGWTEAGDRPVFDVVTGISIGALIAPFAFLGSQYDDVLRVNSTTLRNEDLFVRRRSIRLLLSESLVDNTPFRCRLERAITPELLAEIAAEHAKGRRLYVGSTNLDTKRLVVWDLGAIASRGTPESRWLFINAMMASAAPPGFFPAVRFNVTIDGQQFEEYHVDGGVTRGLFFHPPLIPPSKRENFEPTDLYDSNVYILVAGKLYSDPEGVRPRTFPIAGSSVSSLLSSGTRGDLARVYLLCTLTGMNFRMTAIPADFPSLLRSTEFDPVETTRMFEEGIRQVRAKTVWRTTPPGLSPGEELRSRTGLVFTVQPEEPAQPTPVPAPRDGGTSPSGIPAVPPLEKK